MSAFFEIHSGVSGFSIIRSVYDDHGSLVRVDYHAGGNVFTPLWEQRRVFRWNRSARREVVRIKERLAA